MFNLSPSVRIFVCTRPVDMRLSFDGLFDMVQTQIKQNPYSGALFLFRSRRANFVKLLWWDLDGWAIFAKRLEEGTFRFPDVEFIDGQYRPVEIERSELMMLLEGIDAGSVKRLKRYRRGSDAPVVKSSERVSARRYKEPRTAKLGDSDDSKNET